MMGIIWIATDVAQVVECNKVFIAKERISSLEIFVESLYNLQYKLSS